MLPIESSAYVSQLHLYPENADVYLQTMAVRDIGSITPSKWTSPFAWRDHLPREIAILIRLDEHKAYEHNIHRYFGLRLNMAKR
jgi:hypothetical protein